MLVQLPYRQSHARRHEARCGGSRLVFRQRPGALRISCVAYPGWALVACRSVEPPFRSSAFTGRWSVRSRCSRPLSPNSAATAAIIALAVTIGSWVLDFTIAGHPGLLAWIAQLSLTQTLRPFRAGALVGRTGARHRRRDRWPHCACQRVVAAGHSNFSRKLRRSVPCVLAVAAILGARHSGGVVR